MKRRSLLKLFGLSLLRAAAPGAQAAICAHLPAPLEDIPSDGAVVFGVVPAKPIRTNLPGRIRVRLRNDEFGAAFVRYQRWTRHFIVIDCGDHWELGLEQGNNRTAV